MDPARYLDEVVAVPLGERFGPRKIEEVRLIRTCQQLQAHGAPSGGERGSCLEEPPDRGDRNRDPVRPVSNLVAELAHGALQLEEAQERLRAGTSARNHACRLVAGGVA